jgi:hypothetical protein
VIPYAWHVSATPTIRAQMISAMAAWEAATAVRFVPWTDEIDYVSVRALGNCGSDVGRTGGEQILIVATRCPNGEGALHLVGHALGLLHETQRSDRDDDVSVQWANVQPAKQSELQTWGEQGLSGYDLGAYDVDSVMHPPPDAWIKPGRVCNPFNTSGCTLTQSDGSYLGGFQRGVVSDGDAWAVSRLYAPGWQMAPGAQPPLSLARATGHSLVGAQAADFDGDGLDDVLRPRQDAMEILWGATGSVTTHAATFETDTIFHLGDFDGDGIFAVLIQDSSGDWLTSEGATGTFTTFRSSTALAIDAMRFIDLDGDGQTDALIERFGSWDWAASGTGTWLTWASGMPALADCLLADLTGDGVVDVVWEDTGDWLWMDGATRATATLVTGAPALADTVVADHDGDGDMDLLALDGTQASALDTSTGIFGTPWELESTASEVVVGDFNGDGLHDLLLAQAPLAAGLITDWVWHVPATYESVVDALQAADAHGGGRVEVEAGTFDEEGSASLTNDIELIGAGSELTEITFTGSGDPLFFTGQAVLTGFTMVRNGANSENVLDAGGSYTEIGDVVFDISGSTYGLDIQNGDTWIYDVTISGGHHGITFHHESGLVERLEVSGSASSGVFVYGNSELRFESLLVRNTGYAALDLDTNSGYTVTVRNATLLGGQIGLFSYDTSVADIANLAVYDFSSYGLYCYPSGLSVQASEVWYQDTTETGCTWVGSSPTSTTGMLFDATGRHAAGSVLIDAGDASDAPATDIDGDVRPQDGDGSGTAEVDVGADEY